MSKIKIFGKSMELKQLILLIVALVIIIGAGIYLIRFLFPATPKSTKAATPAIYSSKQGDIDTSILDDSQFQELEDKSSDLTPKNTGRKDPFGAVNENTAETGGSIQ